MSAISDLVFIDSAGYHYSDFPAFLTFVQDKYKGIYGADVYLGSDSQDGQFLAVLAQAFFDTASLGGSVYNSFSPTSAQGTGLSRNVKINGISRRIPSNSTVDLVIVGVTGTVLTDCIAVDTLQQQWSVPSPTVIPISGTITVTATAVEVGAIQALANTITGIFTPTQGWQTVNNPAGATTGAPVETDGQLRIRQTASVANPSLTVFEGTIGAVENVAGVTKVKGYENDTGATDGDGLPAHSISIVALGGIDNDIAAAIQLHKTPGTRTYGTTTVTVDDSHGMPIDIHFYRPTNAKINITVTITPGDNYISGYATLIAEALSEYILAIPIGGSVIITKLYVVAYLVGNPAGLSYNIVSIEISKNTDPVSTSDVFLLFNEVATCDPDNDVTVIT